MVLKFGQWITDKRKGRLE